MTINEKLDGVINDCMARLDRGEDSKLTVMRAVRDTVQLCLNHFSSPLNPQTKGGEQ